MFKLKFINLKQDVFSPRPTESTEYSYIQALCTFVHVCIHMKVWLLELNDEEHLGYSTNMAKILDQYLVTRSKDVSAKSPDGKLSSLN